jgi:hypothetical protein
MVSSRIWYCAVLDAKDVASGEVTAIRRHFTDAIRAAGEPVGACLFVIDGGAAETSTPRSSDDHNGVAVQTAVFFSPASLPVVREVLVRYGAKPSPAPERTGATMLVGEPTDWGLLMCATH